MLGGWQRSSWDGGNADQFLQPHRGSRKLVAAALVIRLVLFQVVRIVPCVNRLRSHVI